MDYEEIKKIFIKIGIVVVLLISLYFVLYSRFIFDDSVKTDFYEGEKTNIGYFNIVTLPMDYFFNYLNKNEYDKAFAMLTEDSKKYFDNNVNRFKNVINKEYINYSKAKKRVRYIFLEEGKDEEGNKTYSFACNLYAYEEGINVNDNKDNFFNTKTIKVISVEYEPFEYKLELDLDSEV